MNLFMVSAAPTNIEPGYYIVHFASNDGLESAYYLTHPRQVPPHVPLKYFGYHDEAYHNYHDDPKGMRP